MNHQEHLNNHAMTKETRPVARKLQLTAIIRRRQLHRLPREARLLHCGGSAVDAAVNGIEDVEVEALET